MRTPEEKPRRNAYMKKWQNEHKDKVREYRKKALVRHRDYNRKWNQEHLEHHHQVRRENRLANIERERERDRIRYLNDPKRKEAIRKYRVDNREKVRQGIRDWANKNRERKRKMDRDWRCSAKGKAYQRSAVAIAHYNRHRWKNGPNRPILILNQNFEGSHMHHIEQRIGIFIPESLHKRFRHNLQTGEGMMEINEAISRWLESST